MYELKWDDRPEYLKDPRQFRGFFAGEGNRTYIPNQFFDVVIPNEKLAVVKVVGAVIRFSIGFQNKWGHRLQKVALSYQHNQNHSNQRPAHARLQPPHPLVPRHNRGRKLPILTRSGRFWGVTNGIHLRANQGSNARISA